MQMRREKKQKQGLNDLAEYIGLSKIQRMVEVGSYRGESTEIWAKYGVFVIAVDPWPKHCFNLVKFNKICLRDVVNGIKLLSLRDILNMNRNVERDFDSVMRRYQNIYKIKSTSKKEAANWLDGSIEFVYIDALHDYKSVKEDINAWLPKIKPGGYIGGHDYCKEWPDVMKAVDEKFGKPLKVFQDTSWVVAI